MTSEMLFYAFHGEVKCSNPVCSQSLTYVKLQEEGISQLNPTTLTRQLQQQQLYDSSKGRLDTESDANLEEHQESPID